jgi:AcrR family transcriptional regulator
MVRDAEKTKARLLAAAVDEFAEFGNAGARVDRIAAAAHTNKQMIYAYFGNKEQLFDAAFSTYVGGSLDRVDFDAADLPAYAGRMFDHFEKDPQTLRLVTWYRLERPDGPGFDAVAALNRLRVQRLTDAQQAGLVTRDLEPVALLVLIQSLTVAWASRTDPEFGGTRRLGRERRRASVVSAVRALVAPAPVSV